MSITDNKNVFLDVDNLEMFIKNIFYDYKSACFLKTM